MTRSATAHTRLFALLGDPVAHSLSPLLHNAALRALDLDGVYLALRCDAGDCPCLLAAIARAGGGGNITIPHKERAATVVERATTAVQRTRACNTYWLENGQVCGDNTDVEGFSRAMQQWLGDIKGAHVLLLGSGGAARAVVAGLVALSASHISVHSRSPERARLLNSIVNDSATLLELASAGAPAFDVIINATPLGLHEHDPLPYPIAGLRPDTAVFDLVYHPDDTAWVRSARTAGLAATDGKQMLLYQAAAAFSRWWPHDAPVDAMRRALMGAAVR
ncbi:MAG: shikimate dehydrogenase [Longimicrobiales bacterium]